MVVVEFLDGSLTIFLRGVPIIKSLDARERKSLTVASVSRILQNIQNIKAVLLKRSKFKCQEQTLLNRSI